MQLEKPKLFADHKSFMLVMSLLIVILLVRLCLSYIDYQAFISKPFYYTDAVVLSENPKEKNGKSYKVLKVRSKEGKTFYTSAYQQQEFVGRQVRFQIFPDKTISFKGYLDSFYVKSRIKEVTLIPEALKQKLVSIISSQHNDQNIASFYNAIFFATPLDKKIRTQVAKLGISHLVALSGFHLSILWGLVYGILLVGYRPLQQRYFPYRFALIDVGIVSILVLAFYLWFVDSPPSLVRSYAMVVIGWFIVILGMELVSFTFLATTVGLLLAVMPSLLVSMSFWLSVAGVFAIFLLLQYTKGINGKWMTFVLLPFGIFILMQPIVHAYFGVTTHYQLLSPLLSLLFIPFYPIAILMHLFGYGNVLDETLIWLFALSGESMEKLVPLGAMALYILVGIGAIFSKRMFVLLVLSALGYMGYLYT